MGRMNAGGSGATVSARIDRDVLEAFDEWWEDSDRFESRTDALQHAMKACLESNPAHETPLEPPEDDDLRRSYLRLYRAANRDGVLPERAAINAAIRGSRQNLSKDEARPMVLKPLQRRGYIQMQSDYQGNVSYKLTGT